MPYCSNCGAQVSEEDKFCSQCGKVINKESSRKTVYEGEIHKCPNCGEILDSFVSTCPSCGYELRNTETANSVKELYKNIQSAKSDSEIITLIKLFPVPNSKEDILEFMILADSNFSEEDYLLHIDDGNSISAAWLSKLEQCYKKAHLSLELEDISKVDEIYVNIKERVDNAKEILNERQMSKQTEVNSKEFKKSKFRFILIFFSIISVFLCVFAFQDGSFLASIISMLMVALFLISFLMGSGVIRERVKNLRLVPAILAFLLIAPYFSLATNEEPKSNQNNYKDEIENINWNGFALGSNLPDFGFDQAEVVSDSDDHLTLYFYDMESSKYESYIEDCKEYGYTIDADDSGANYTAYNEEGYYLHLQYLDFSNNRLMISLEDTIENNSIEWPSSALVKDVPKPDFLVGEVSIENDEAYAVYLTQIEPSYFREYVSLCMENGFDDDYSKSDTYFYAKNNDDISLTVEYKGNKTLYIYAENYDF